MTYKITNFTLLHTVRHTHLKVPGNGEFLGD